MAETATTGAAAMEAVITSIVHRLWLEAYDRGRFGTASKFGTYADTVPKAVGELLAAALAPLNTPEVENFAKGVVSEAQHQRHRFGAAHDAGKTPLDWFWLIGYLSQKAATAHIAGDTEKALHHTISTAAALANWHAAISGANTSMRPGIEPPTPDTGEQSQ